MLLFATLTVTLSWLDHSASTTASLRGLDVGAGNVIWASGTKGTYLESTDAGKRWKTGNVAGAGNLDFRGVKGFDEHTAMLLSSGPGNQSRVYKTIDAGEHWRLLFTNPDEKGFFDGIAFWNTREGIILGDPVNSQFTIFTTSDGGEHWTRQSTPPALPNEGAFAASNTSLVVRGDGLAWFGTGGPGAGRVFYSGDHGHTWKATTTPLSGASPSSGIYSLSFLDDMHGVAVGGDYQHPEAMSHTIALTKDGGHTWRKPNGELGGYRSAAMYISQQVLVAVGPSGCDESQDGGATWHNFSKTGFNALAGKDIFAWGAGSNGRLMQLLILMFFI